MLPFLLDFLTVFFILAGSGLLWLNISQWRRNRNRMRIAAENGHAPVTVHMDNDVDATIEFTLREEIRDYVQRGRAFADRDNHELMNILVAAEDLCSINPSAETQQIMDDARSEIRLRGAFTDLTTG